MLQNGWHWDVNNPPNFCRLGQATIAPFFAAVTPVLQPPPSSWVTQQMFSSEGSPSVIWYDSPLGPLSDEWLYLDGIVFGLISVDTHDSFYFVLQSPCST